jgi:DNA polymerase-3 subunit beta
MKITFGLYPVGYPVPVGRFALLDFPALPETEQNQLISLDGTLIREMIQKTIFSISIEDTRYNLSGIYFEHLDQEGHKVLRMVATDGHRLSLMDKEIGEFNEEVFPKGVLLPRKAVTELLKILDKPGPIQFGFKENNGLIIKDQICLLCGYWIESFRITI